MFKKQLCNHSCFVGAGVPPQDMYHPINAQHPEIARILQGEEEWLQELLSRSSPIRGSESPPHLRWKETVARARGLTIKDCMGLILLIETGLAISVQITIVQSFLFCRCWCASAGHVSPYQCSAPGDRPHLAR